MPAKCLGGGRRIFCTFCAVSIIEIFFFKRATAAAADKIFAKMPQCPLILIFFRWIIYFILHANPIRPQRLPVLFDMQFIF